ncbi:hypothetical protein PCANC_01453 [Puccinia coronata f. sp. avenae]|uniref:Uncharacterized protein n=1 Tax=Puccinia coronata f. sp. avenae TaxID=200324 RepID=A0A2N5W331_9BASI|nr:hypothetical protein PCANC_01453 [Puccinia coronata f. sp. avenae]
MDLPKSRSRWLSSRWHNSPGDLTRPMPRATSSGRLQLTSLCPRKNATQTVCLLLDDLPDCVTVPHGVERNDDDDDGPRLFLHYDGDITSLTVGALMERLHQELQPIIPAAYRSTTSRYSLPMEIAQADDPKDITSFFPRTVAPRLTAFGMLGNGAFTVLAISTPYMYIKHGYVASRNILVTHHGMVKLVDFAQAIIFEKERVAPGGIDGEMEAVEALLLRKLEATSNTSAAGIPRR